MGYIDTHLFIFSYSRESLTNAILLAFGTQKGKLNTLSKKIKKALTYLNDNSFWYGCEIAIVTGIRLVKYAMKFMESG
jgi:hypothetical protein